MQCILRLLEMYIWHVMLPSTLAKKCIFKESILLVPADNLSFMIEFYYSSKGNRF